MKLISANDRFLFVDVFCNSSENDNCIDRSQTHLMRNMTHPDIYMMIIKIKNVPVLFTNARRENVQS